MLKKVLSGAIALLMVFGTGEQALPQNIAVQTSITAGANTLEDGFV